MRGDSVKLLLIAGVVAFAVLYGMELSESGIQRVHGPLEQPVPSVETNTPDSNDDVWTLPDPQEDPRMPQEDVRVEIPRYDRKPLVDRISGTAAETLHHISSGGIRFVVGLFDKVTGS